MPGKVTNDDIFKRAIAVEDLQGEFYKILSEMFDQQPEIENFWKGMADDETDHTNLLKSIGGALPPDRLQAEAGRFVVSMANDILKISAEERASYITNLDDAYELAYDQQNYELNIVFKFLVREFSRSNDVRSFALAEVENHIQKLWDFPRTFGNSEWRESIKIKDLG
jgi:rubrerythrin